MTVGAVDYDRAAPTATPAADTTDSGEPDLTGAGSANPTASILPAIAPIGIPEAGPKLIALPGTAGEIAAIERAFVDAFDRPAVSLTRDGATRRALLAAASSARFLHVATHGTFAADAASRTIYRRGAYGFAEQDDEALRAGADPFALSCLALSGANLARPGEHAPVGLVTAGDLAALDLRGCELAVLSACETNVGLRRPGRGVQSFRQALHFAGARATLTSLWKVPDEATRDLMIEMYRRMWQEGESKAEALLGAQRMLRDRGHPVRDWAAWILTGDVDGPGDRRSR